MRIGELAARSKVSTRALRYYGEQGILASECTHSGQRIYGEDAVARVRLIQQFFAAGLASSTIVDILPCVDTGHTTPELFERLSAERDRIAASIAELQDALRHLDGIIHHAEHPTPEHCPALRVSSTEALAA